MSKQVPQRRRANGAAPPNKLLLHRNRTKLIATISETGNITKSCELLGITRDVHYEAMKDPEYVREFNEAMERSTERLEEEVRRRAVEGYDEPVFYQGVKCGVVRKYSDYLLMFLLKGRKPEKYRDHYVMPPGSQAPPSIITNIQFNLRGLDEAALRTILDATGKLVAPPTTSPAQPGSGAGGDARGGAAPSA